VSQCKKTANGYYCYCYVCQEEKEGVPVWRLTQQERRFEEQTARRMGTRRTKICRPKGRRYIRAAALHGRRGKQGKPDDAVRKLPAGSRRYNSRTQTKERFFVPKHSGLKMTERALSQA